jgi:GNAT superfamily N-acetyltransferase
MSYKIKAAQTSDLADLVDLNNAIQRQHADGYPNDFRHPTDRAEVREFFAHRLDHEDHEVLIVRSVAGLAIGYFWHEVKRSQPNPFSKPKTRLLIHHVFVRPSHRRQGIADALFDKAHEAATALGVDEISLNTWASNSAAHKFFARQGFEALRIDMRKAL